ncbi:MAG: M15 family metallopeptidase, partial [Defluviitaleaceae bacterium]|nr:M15 family metallopeptidase [Defluviitaleaceae bacterium]
DLADLEAGFIFDVVYASDDNFMGEALYDIPLCLAHEDLARALIDAQKHARELGLGLIIYDAYRPVSAQIKMRDLAPEGQKHFVATVQNANHPRGAAVDCSLADESGEPLAMPSGFDELTERAAVNYAGGTDEERANRDLLIKIMHEAGLRVAAGEWWHFALEGAGRYESMDFSFEEFMAGRDSDETD